MAVLRLRVPPEEFSKTIGDNGSYSLTEGELFGLPYGSSVEIEDSKKEAKFKVMAGEWKECGILIEGRIYLPIEYFTKK